jgi:WD40 repeat protein
MNFLSTEFDDAVTAACQGGGSEADIAALHATLQADEAARDEYLWQVELHSYLGAMAPNQTTLPAPAVNGDRRFPTVSRRALVRWALAGAAVAMAFIAGLYWHWRNSPGPERKSVAILQGAPKMPDDKHSDRRIEGSGLAAQGLIRPTVQFAVASDAPIIVGTGGQEPIELGAEVPYESGGNTLHVWDWSRSKLSKVLKDIRLFPDQKICVSPDGTWLVMAKGDVVNLTTGERSTIDLGGEFYLSGLAGTLQRIEYMQFTPDGRRLALLVYTLGLTKSPHPLRRQDLTASPTMQIVDFPSGKLVCDFPAGDQFELPPAFSADGKRVVLRYPQGDSASKIVERSALTGEIRREYEPHLREFAYALGLSADGSLLAVYDSAGQALLWDTETGKLKHKILVPRDAPGAHLRFSPNGKLLALSLFPGISPKLILIDVAAGAVLATVPQETSGDMHWAADSKTFDVIYDQRGISEQPDKDGRPVMFNLFPTIRTWKVADLRRQ